MKEYAITLYIGGSISQVRTSVKEDAKIDVMKEMLACYGGYLADGLVFRFDVQVMEEPKVLSAEEWVRTYCSFYFKADGGDIDHIERERMSKAFKAGEANRDLLYAELMEELKEYLKVFKSHQLMRIYNKIKERDASI
jgi:hypothetical protein